MSTLLVLSCNRKTSQVSNSNTSKDSISFLIVGDWGRQGGQAQSDVAKQMNTYAARHDVDFIISTGDNFYPSGVTSVSDPQWQLSFEDLYDQPAHKVRWYPVLGNHDYVLNAQAQVDYSLNNERWTMPSRYYTINKKVNKETSALFVFTDTSPFVDAYHNGGMGDVAEQDTASQLKWLNYQLRNSQDEWKIVIGHHPVYSAGPHMDTKEMINKFKPLLLQTATDFYISGHDHSLQHLKLPGESIDYLVSGAGSQSTRIKQHPYDKFSSAIAGFMVMTLYPEHARLYTYNKRGRMIYSSLIPR